VRVNIDDTLAVVQVISSAFHHSNGLALTVRTHKFPNLPWPVQSFISS